MDAAVEQGVTLARIASPAARPAAPLDDSGFADLMRLLEPFERRPRLAVAVSGGADSLALTLLAARWAAAREGSVLALTVDHGLREGSAAEAAQVGAWLAARGIAHRVLAWSGPKPASGIQAAARAARYALLLDCCRAEGILHLLVAHHRDDQAETYANRLAQKSGDVGLAAMAPVMPTPAARLLRPLLPVPKTRLQATLAAMGQAWIEDPSNRDPAFLRVRTRARLAAVDAGADLAEAAARAEARKRVLEAEAAALLACAARVSAAGCIWLDAPRLAAAPDAVGLHALASVLRTVGGGGYPPGREPLERLWTELRAGLGLRRSLAGCLLSPSRDGLLVHREPAAMAGRLPVRAGALVHWDGRFLLRLAGQGEAAIGPLGRHWPGLRERLGPDVARPAWPAAVSATLPALFDDDGVAAVPHFSWRRNGFAGPIVVDCAFAPTSPLTGGLVWHRCGTMC